MVTPEESVALKKTARAYGSAVNRFLGQERYDDAFREATKVRLLLEMLPQPDEEVTRLVKATDQALVALREMGCSEHLFTPRLPPPPQAPPTRRPPASAMVCACTAIGLLVLLVACALAWPSFLARQDARRHEVAARASITAMKGLLAGLRSGMTYREFVDFMGNQVTPAAMNLRVTSYASGTRTRKSFHDLDSAYQVLDATSQAWRTRRAQLGMDHLVITLGKASDDPVVTAVQEQWAKADAAIDSGTQALDRGD